MTNVLARVRENLRTDLLKVANNWLVISTAVLFVFALAIWLLTKTEVATAFATYLSGFAAAFAFLWLAAGFRIQTQELSLQRQELQLQRIASQQQAREMANASKLSSLSQIHTLIQDAEKVVSNSPLNINLTDMPVLYMNGIQHWKNVENSRIPQTVIDSYSQWLPIESVARNYIRHIASAMRLYLEHHYPNAIIDHSKSEDQFVYIYQSWLTKAPFLSHHIGIAAMLAQYMSILKPGTDRMLLAVTVAHAKLVGSKLFKREGLCEMRQKVLDHSDTLPAICEPWPFAEGAH